MAFSSRPSDSRSSSAEGTTTRSCAPDAAGSFTLDSLPVGPHPLRMIYTPANDTLLRYVTILPRHKSPVSFKFASASSTFARV